MVKILFKSFYDMKLLVGVILVISSLIIIFNPDLFAFFAAGIMLFAGVYFISAAIVFKKNSQFNILL